MLEIKSTMDVFFVMHQDNLPFDYQVFTDVCEKNKVPVVDIMNFARFMGAVKTAAALFPGDEITVAYEKFNQQVYEQANSPVLMPEHMHSNMSTPGSYTSDCGTCGGGTVR